jgi:ribosome-associated toxin RatA of RatAB toxin-antitoxin module
MRTVDRLQVRAPAGRVFHAALDVEQWPELLSHYRWVRFLERRPDGGLVEMAAWRPFGWFNYPTWWVSEMWIDRAEGTVRYRHVQGITTGMDVEWRVNPIEGGADVSIVHEWGGPGWPVLGGLAAGLVIGPVFIHGIASRTLAGIAKHVETSGTERAAGRP